MLNVALPQRIRAGCDADPLIRQYGLTLCLSAFARVATTKNRKQIYSQFFASAHSRGLRPAVVVNIHACDDLCHSAFARVATMAKSSQYLSPTLCHSAFARVATKRAILITVRQDLCHSAFVRVATLMALTCSGVLAFATAHSRGLRPRRSGSGLPSRIFATAHSRGLRPRT